MRALAGLVASLALTFAAAPADAALVTRQLDFAASDGVRLHAAVGGEGSLVARPLVIEFSPYGQGCCAAVAGPGYNYVEVDDRGTGASGGSWDEIGDRSDHDVAEFMGWACRRPWSDGRIALIGASASAISVYNAMKLALPCLRTAVLWAGTSDLYRDLTHVGGVPDPAVLAFVGSGIVGGAILDGGLRIDQRPQTLPDAIRGGLEQSADFLTHATEDPYWRERNFTGDVNHVPILEDTGFFDPEERGPFETFTATRGDGSRLLVQGAHDGPAGGSAAPWDQAVRTWLDHYVRGVEDGAERQPAVQLWLADGSRENLARGKPIRMSTTAWPVPGTRWTPLYLDATRSRTASSINDGSLAPRRPAAAVQLYPIAASDPLAGDPHNASVIDAALKQALSTYVPLATQMAAAEPTALTYTTAPLARAADVVGPGSLDVFASSSAPETDLCRGSRRRLA